ncbi:hypothetical protein LTR16_010944, partial [Cryomyces antarcticus]
ACMDCQQRSAHDSTSIKRLYHVVRTFPRPHKDLSSLPQRLEIPRYASPPRAAERKHRVRHDLRHYSQAAIPQTPHGIRLCAPRIPRWHPASAPSTVLPPSPRPPRHHGPRHRPAGSHTRRLFLTEPQPHRPRNHLAALPLRPTSQPYAPATLHPRARRLPLHPARCHDAATRALLPHPALP